MMRTQKGFTLIEMMIVVVVIIGILTPIAFLQIQKEPDTNRRVAHGVEIQKMNSPITTLQAR